MEQIVAYGCSHTYGHGLPDCYDPVNHAPGPAPSKLGWVAQLGNLTGLPVFNYSDPGASIKEVTLRALKFPPKTNSIVLVHWPHFSRTGILNVFEEHFNIDKIHVSSDDKLSELYYKYFFNDVEGVISKIPYIKALEKICIDTDSTLVNIFYSQYEQDHYEPYTKSLIHNRVFGEYIHEMDFELTPDQHLGVEGNFQMAKDLFEFIKEKKVL